jgi:hypothetical protein
MSNLLFFCEPCDGRNNESIHAMRMHKEVANRR